ncbi:glycosyltransferase [Chitinophagaceae bacterium 26-R-25]|nr:glycosyltransferase [Chitinophagaceae bacterium 26-R-25]
MNSKAILVITENFAFGGLETQLYGYFRQLKKSGYKIILATGEKVAVDNPYIELVDEMLSGLSLSGGVNNIEFNNTYLQICRIIDDHGVGVIHCQPFFAFLPAFFASQEKRVPFIYSLHGPVSFTYIENPLHEFLLKAMVLQYASIVHCVSPEMVTMSLPFTASNAFLVPNLVDTEILAPVDREDHAVNANNEWAIFSRLDETKNKGIIDFIQKTANSGISKIDIYGDGPARKQLEDFISNNQSGAVVELKGFYKLEPELLSKYTGIAGMGRVVLEALSTGKPCILIGYDGVKGLIDKELFEFSSTWNFSGRGLKTISADQVLADLEKLEAHSEQYSLRELVVANHDELKHWGPFINKLNNLAFREYSFAKNIFDSIKILENPEEPILYSQSLPNKIFEMLSLDVEDPNSKLSAAFLKQKSISSLQSERDRLEKDNQRLMSEMSNLSNDLSNNRISLQKANAKVGVCDLLEEELKEKVMLIEELRRDNEKELIARKDLEKSLEDFTHRIQQLEKSVSWYHATYESRSFLGVVKDKAFKKIK